MLRISKEAARRFAAEYLRSHDEARAARAAGLGARPELLARCEITRAIDEARAAKCAQLQPDDAACRAAELAFGRANDCVKLALGQATEIDSLDLSLLSEIKVTDKGVELKLIDRLGALRLLSELRQPGAGGQELLRMLGEGGGEP